MARHEARVWTLLTCLMVTVGAAVIDEELPSYWMTSAREELRQATSRPTLTGPAKNLILFVGDGMGVSTVTAARILKGQMAGKSGEETSLSFEEFPNVALSKTYSLDYQTTDSAATATAFLCGVKVKKSVLGVDGRVDAGDCAAGLEHPVTSVLDWALDSGRSVGVVTTTRVTHATPAAAYAHSAERDWEGDSEMSPDILAQGCRDIAAQLVDDNPNIQVVLGGGRRYFMREDQADPEDGSYKDHRLDGRDLIQEWLDDKAGRQLQARYVWNASAFDAVDPDTTDYLLGLFEASHMNYEVDRTQEPTEREAGEPSLADMVDKAVRILKKNPNGFFLLVEGGRIDHGHHANRAARALRDAVALDEAVTSATRLTSQEDTLTVVTADHSHVFVMSGYPSRGNPILGLVDIERKESDGLPYTTLLYGNGPGFAVDETGTRENLTGVDTADKDYRQQSAVFMGSETHAGEDVAIFARGPWAHLLHGVHEQNYIAHVLAYAGCIGPYSDPLRCGASSHASQPCPANSASRRSSLFSYLRSSLGTA